MKTAEFIRKVDELGHRYSAVYFNNSIIVYQKKIIKGKLLNKILFIIHLDNKSVNLELSKQFTPQYPHVKESKEYKLRGVNTNFYIADYSFENLPYWNNLNTLVDEFINGLD
ncbi:hypothetical protein HWC08_gp069 [Lactobacillus phage 521B]|uniref:Uncharacterized protein n=1 Tax=Lactobacillus phage 521B TaxID=2510942 RepID=A0A4Y5FEE0_9CAUD|nr:hypothetical protein HWC08_gp069 [Lactobacillus phage 521B]QBJ03419.1 hypothetical protein B521_0069 [Lactobacillus phage 521B]